MVRRHVGVRGAFMLRVGLRRFALPALAAAMGLAVSLGVFARMNAHADAAVHARFREHAGWMRDRFTEELRSAEAALLGARAFMECSDGVSRQEWREYVEMTRVTEMHPGVLGLSYIAIVPDDEIGAFTERARADGAPDFTVHPHRGGVPVPVGDPHYIVLYHEPAERNRSAWGLDVTTHPINLEAYQAASASDEVRVSRGFRLFQLPDPESRGVVMALPVRPAGGEIAGWVAAPVVVDDAFTKTAGTRWRGSWVRVTETTDGRDVLYEAGERPPGESWVSMPVGVGGRVWAFECAPSGALGVSGARAEALCVLVLGAALSLLTGVVILALTRTRDRAREIATQMTRSYAESEAKGRLLAEQAREASAAKTLFLANMSHEMRTPLTSVIGDADLLEEERDRLGEGGLEALEAIQRNGQRLLRLVDDALDITRPDDDTDQVRARACPLGDALRDALRAFRQEAEEAGVRTEMTGTPGEELRVWADPLRLHQALANLIDNAIVFAGRGGVVRVDAQRAGARVRIRVSDTGPGVPEGARKRIFEPFYQTDPTHTRAHGGAGLGLAIARRYVRRMGGELTLEGEPASTFVIDLPLAGETTPEAPAPTPAEGLRGSVLVAEDGADTRRLISWILRQAGLEVALCADGSAAVQSALEAQRLGEPFDVVLMDMQMPVLDGYDAARTLRARGYTGAIIALTAHAMPGDRERCIAAGCDGYQTKPVDRNALLAEIAGRIGLASSA